MDEYQNDYYQNFQEGQHFSHFLLDQQSASQKIQLRHDAITNQNKNNDKIQDLRTDYTCLYGSQQPRENAIKQNKRRKEFKKQRKIRKIQTNTKVQIKNQFTFSGSKNDTVELNTNFKTLFKNFIRQNYADRSDQVEILIQQFQKSVSSFKSFSKLFSSNSGIKQFCTEFIRSSGILKNILRSRAKFWMRLQMIKYIQALSKNIQSPKYVRWKSIRKYNN